MTVRRRFLITPLLLCHLLVLHCLVTSQLRPAQPVPTEEVTVEASKQEKIGNVAFLHGKPGVPVRIQFRSYILVADEITFDYDTGDVTASGNLIFDGGPNDLHLEASRGNYNIRSEVGKFYEVTGTTGARVRGKHVLLTSSN